MIAFTHLWLEQFRNYPILELEVGARPVVIIGRNGAGKTNILEALSLFMPGRGMRRASLRDMCRGQTQGMFAVAACLRKHHASFHLATSCEPQSARDMRTVKIDGARERSHAALCRYVSVTWLTPQMDTLFIEGQTARRKLMDRLVYAFDPEHAERVLAYEQSMRERTRLLSSRMGDDNWLSILEQQMAQHAVAIAIARRDTLDRITQAMQQAQHPFARAQWYWRGTVEGWLESGMTALDCEIALTERLAAVRMQDAQALRATEGVHRSRLDVMHAAKKMPAEQCSTGEQKSMLISLLIAHATARKQWSGEPPICLLDEVVAHLDVEHRKELFDAMLEGGMQTWMTGTEAADFQALDADVAWVGIDNMSARVSYTRSI